MQQSAVTVSGNRATVRQRSAQRLVQTLSCKRPMGAAHSMGRSGCRWLPSPRAQHIRQSAQRWNSQCNGQCNSRCSICPRNARRHLRTMDSLQYASTGPYSAKSDCHRTFDTPFDRSFERPMQRLNRILDRTSTRTCTAFSRFSSFFAVASSSANCSASPDHSAFRTCVYRHVYTHMDRHVFGRRCD